MRKIKILHIYIGSLSGGLLTFQKNLNNELVKDPNFEIYLLYGTSERTHSNYKSFFDPRIHLIEGENFGYGCGFSPIGYIKRIRIVRNVLKEVKPDVVHLHSFRAGWICRLFVHHRNMFYTPHGFRAVNKEIKPWKRKFSLLIEKMLANHDTTIVGSSPSEYDVCKTINNNTVEVDNGINMEELVPYTINGFGENAKAVIYNIARAVIQKNPADFNEIASISLDFQFHWIGGGDLQYLLTSPNINVVGWGPREEALELSKKCNIYLSTSLWEGLSLSLLEAMAMKKLCIVANVPGLRDVIRNGENGFIYNTPHEVHDILLDVEKNPLKYKKIAEKGYMDVASLYSSVVMADKYKKIYLKRIINNK